MGKNVAVFVDVANIFYAAKAAGVDIDYVTLLKAAVAGRDFVRAYAYTGLDPENENQRNFHSFLARHGYKVVSKDIRKYGDGKVKANLDIELVVDMMKTARNLDVAIVVSGDGDFAPAIRAVQEMGVRVEVISFRGNTSSDLIEVADIFTDISQIARVDRDSQRSGRRVAGDEEDLSMTEVPDKQTEGAPRRRRGRGRGERPEVAAASGSNGTGGRSGGGGRNVGGGRMLVLPGEKLSRAAADRAAAAAASSSAPAAPEELEEQLVDQLGDIEVFTERDAQIDNGDAQGEGEGRRRRRRGGRGRGRGRGQGEQLPAEAGTFVETDEVEAVEEDVTTETVGTPSLAAPANRPNPFGSVWDSQIGMATQPTDLAPLPPDEEDYAEPEIPEYLLAERRRGRGGRGGQGGGRGGARSAYVSAMERERFGRSRYPEPARPMPQQQQRRREERPPRQQQPQRQAQPQPQRPARTSNEPWSEVPDELEDLLRAQLAAKMSRASENQPKPEQAAPEAATSGNTPAQASESAAGAPEAAAAPVAPRGRGRRRAAETATAAAVAPQESAASGGVQVPAEEPATQPAPSVPPVSRRRPRKSADAVAEAAASASVDAAGTTPEPETATPKRRAPARRKAAAADTAEAAVPEPPTAEPVAAAPKRRAPARRRTAAAATDDGGTPTEGAGE